MQGTTTVTGGYAVVVLLAFAVPLLVLGALRLGPLGWLLGLGSAGLTAWHARCLLTMDDDTMAREADEAEAAFLAGMDTLRRAVDEVSRLRLAAARAGSRLEATRRISEERAEALRSQEWRTARGATFVDFVAAALEREGFVVERVEGSMPLVVTRGGRRLGVRVEGAPGRTLGEAAVHEATEAADRMGFDGVGVVTNGRFSTGAKAEAARRRCVLVDARGVLAMLHGKSPL
jgi:hypothetical protein